MKAKKIWVYLLIVVSLFLVVTACARKSDDQEPVPSEAISSQSSLTTSRPRETDPILTDPVDTDPSGTGEPTDSSESSEETQESISPTSVSQTKTQSTRSQTSTTVTLPTYTLPTYTVDRPTSESTPAKTTAKNLSKEYEAVYKDYANRLRNQTPTLISEYKKEAKANTSGPIALGWIKTQKVAALTQTETEGTAEMTFLRLQTNGDADDPEYNKWVENLGKVYRDELAKLRAAFD